MFGYIWFGFCHALQGIRDAGYVDRIWKGKEFSEPSTRPGGDLSQKTSDALKNPWTRQPAIFLDSVLKNVSFDFRFLFSSQVLNDKYHFYASFSFFHEISCVSDISCTKEYIALIFNF